MASPRRWATVRKATAHGVELVRGAEVKEITASDVVFVLADGEPHTVPADDVIIAGEVTTGAPLADALRARGLEVHVIGDRSEEHTSELQSLMRISYAVFCLKKKNCDATTTTTTTLHTLNHIYLLAFTLTIM